MQLPDDFYISLASDESADYFDHANKKSKFTNKLPEPLILNSKYSVALTEIYIPPFYAHSSKNIADIKTEEETESNEIKRLKRSATDSLRIKMTGTEWEIYLSADELTAASSTPLRLSDLLALFSDHIRYSETHLALDDPTEHFETIFKKFDDMIDTLDWKIAVNKIEGVQGSSITVMMPTSTTNVLVDYPIFDYKNVIIKGNEFSNLRDFFEHIISQLKPSERSRIFILKELTTIGNPENHFATTEIYRQIMSKVFESQKVKLIEAIKKSAEMNGGAQSSKSEVDIDETSNGSTVGDVPQPNDKATQTLQSAFGKNGSESSPKITQSSVGNASNPNPPASIPNPPAKTPNPQKPESIIADVNSTVSSLNPIEQNKIENALLSSIINELKESRESSAAENESHSYKMYRNSRKAANLLPHLHMIFVFSDVVGYHWYANKRYKLLRTIPNYYSVNTFNDGLWIRFDTPEYYPVSENYIESISIAVTNREYPINFARNNSQPIYCQLHFKKLV